MFTISTMTGKLEGISATNVNSLDIDWCNAQVHTPSYVDTVCGHCYSRRMLKTFRKNCRAAWKKNGKVLSASVMPFDLMPKIKTKFHRIHAHGEVINTTHANNIFKLIKFNPDVIFSWPTKRPLVVLEAMENWGKPKNLVLILSNNTMNTVIAASDLPRGFDLSFNVFAGPFIEPGVVNCEGKCSLCLRCYTPNTKQGVVIEKLK